MAKPPPKIPNSIPLPTEAQRAVIQTIARLMRANRGKSPSYNEIAAELGITKAGAQAAVRKLEERGFLTRSEYVVVFELTPEGKRWL